MNVRHEKFVALRSVISDTASDFAVGAWGAAVERSRALVSSDVAVQFGIPSKAIRPARRDFMGGTNREARRGVRLRSPAPPNDADAQSPLRTPSSAFVHVVDDDQEVLESLGDLLRSMNYQVALYRSASDFLKVELPDAPACLVLDVRLPGTSGLELQQYLASNSVSMPIILVTGFGDVPMSVRAMKLGAVDFLTKPIRNQDLLDAVAAAIRMDQERRREIAQIALLREKYARLTVRERQVMALVASGLLNKQVATELSISEVTVKMHRGSLMRKLGAKSLAMLVRIAEALESRGDTAALRPELTSRTELT